MPDGNMTDREMIYELRTKMIGVGEDIGEIKELLKSRPYPCIPIGDHEKRLHTIEIEKKVIIGVLVVSVPLFTALLVFILDRMF